MKSERVRNESEIFVNVPQNGAKIQKGGVHEGGGRKDCLNQGSCGEEDRWKGERKGLLPRGCARTPGLAGWRTSCNTRVGASDNAYNLGTYSYVGSGSIISNWSSHIF